MSLEETIRRIAGDPLPENEEVAKFRVIGPILEELGWDVRNLKGNLEVEFERTVGPGKGAKQAGRSDIALMRITRGKNECVCLVEAKAPSKRLDDHVDQLVSYAFHEGVDLCVLTNAQDWWLYLPLEKRPFPERRFASLSLKGPPGQLADELEQFLGRENVLNGKAEIQAKRRLKALKDVESLNVELPNIWNKMLSGPDQDLVELITRRVSAEIDLSPSPDQIKALLQGEVLPSLPIQSEREQGASNASKYPKTKPKLPAVPLPTEQKARSTNRFPKPGYFVFEGVRYEVSSWAALWLKTCEIMAQRYGERLTNILEENWKKGKPKISTLEDSFARSKRVPNSPFWADTDVGGHETFEFLGELLEATGHNMSDLLIYDKAGQLITTD